jgi:hypothetical protein
MLLLMVELSNCLTLSLITVNDDDTHVAIDSKDDGDICINDNGKSSFAIPI